VIICNVAVTPALISSDVIALLLTPVNVKTNEKIQKLVHLIDYKCFKYNEDHFHLLSMQITGDSIRQSVHSRGQSWFCPALAPHQGHTKHAVQQRAASILLPRCLCLFTATQAANLSSGLPHLMCM